VGRGFLLIPEQRTMFGLWAMFKSPLFFAVDLTFVPPPSREILLSEEVLAIHQDPLRVAADRIWKEGPLEVLPLVLHNVPLAVVPSTQTPPCSLRLLSPVTSHAIVCVGSFCMQGIWTRSLLSI
jgi:Alpha galactosidase A